MHKDNVTTTTGFHSIEEKLKSLKDSTASGYKLYYSKPGPRVKKIIAAAKEAGIAATQVEDKKLDEMVSSLSPALRDHRGLVLEIEGEQKKSVNIVDFDAWLKILRKRDLYGCNS